MFVPTVTGMLSWTFTSGIERDAGERGEERWAGWSGCARLGVEVLGPNAAIIRTLMASLIDVLRA